MIARYDLDRRFRRPAINIGFADEMYPALIDTGAELPVFTLGARKMAELGGRLTMKDVEFSGFGGACRGGLYRMELGFGLFRYIDLPVICAHDAEMMFAFILPATMFTYTSKRA